MPSRMSTCPHCQGFLPEGAAACPHCSASVDRRSSLPRMAALAGGLGLIAITLMACYGGPPCEDCGVDAGDGGAADGGSLDGG